MKRHGRTDTKVTARRIETRQWTQAGAFERTQTAAQLLPQRRRIQKGQRIYRANALPEGVRI